MNSATFANSSLHQKENKSIQLNMICWSELALSSKYLLFLRFQTDHQMHAGIIFNHNGFLFFSCFYSINVVIVWCLLALHILDLVSLGKYAKVLILP